MKSNSLSFITLRIFLFPLKSTAQGPATIQCHTLLPDQHVSPVQCERYDGSIVEVDDSGPFNCKLSFVTIRPKTTKGSTDQQPEAHRAEYGECKLWLYQFSDDGNVYQTCCGEAGEGLVSWVFRAQGLPDRNFDLERNKLNLHESLQKPVQHYQADGRGASGDEGLVKNEENYDFDYGEEDGEGELEEDWFDEEEEYSIEEEEYSDEEEEYSDEDEREKEGKEKKGEGEKKDKDDEE